MRGGLLGCLLGSPPPGTGHLVPEHRFGLVLTVVPRPGEWANPVTGGVAGPLLRHLLQAALEVLVAPFGQVADVLQKHLRRSAVALVEEDRADQSLEGIGQKRRQGARPGLGRAAADEERRPQLETFRETRERRRVDQRSPELCQLPFVVDRETAEQVIADDELEHRVTEILEALVVVPGAARLSTLVVPRRVGHSLTKQLGPPKADAGALLQGVEPRRLLGCEPRWGGPYRGQRYDAAPTFSWM